MSTSNSIARLNDAFRTSFNGGLILHTDGFAVLPEEVRAEIDAKVRAYDRFTPDNDPYGEHDFGAFDQPDAGKIFWKIDYCDEEVRLGSVDPADPSRTVRVLTIMLAEEY